MLKTMSNNKQRSGGETRFMCCGWNGSVKKCFDPPLLDWDILLWDIIHTILCTLAHWLTATHTHMVDSQLVSHTPLVLLFACSHWLLWVFCNYSSEQGAISLFFFFFLFLAWQMVQHHAASGNRDNRLPPRS